MCCKNMTFTAGSLGSPRVFLCYLVAYIQHTRWEIHARMVWTNTLECRLTCKSLRVQFCMKQIQLDVYAC